MALNLLDKAFSRRIIFSSFILVITTFFLIHRVFVKDPGRLELVASYGLYPLIKVQQYFIYPVITSFTNRTNYQILQKQYQDLQKERDSLHQKIIELQASKVFMEITQELQEFKKRYETDKALLTQVIARRLNNREQILLIDGGEKQGVQKDQAVVWKNCIVGKIDQVYPYYSKVITVADKQCHVTAYCDKTQTVGIIQGNNKIDQLQLCFVDHLKTLKLDDTIYSSGQGTIFPRGFLLGTLEQFQVQGIHYQAFVKPALNLQELEYCYVLQKNMN